MGYADGSDIDTTQEFPPASEPLTEDELSGLHYDASGVPFGPRRGPAQSQRGPHSGVAVGLRTNRGRVSGHGL